MQNKIKYLQNKIEIEIPVSKAMGINIYHIDNEMIKLSAPLDLNKNGKNTGFAGSIYSVMALSGWIFLTYHIMNLKLDAVCVVHKGNIEYIKPVKKDLEVICMPLSKEELERFLFRLKSKSRSNIFLNAKIYDKNNVIVNFDGDYVAWKTKEDC